MDNLTHHNLTELHVDVPFTTWSAYATILIIQLVFLSIIGRYAFMVMLALTLYVFSIHVGILGLQQSQDQSVLAFLVFVCVACFLHMIYLLVRCRRLPDVQHTGVHVEPV
jgi:hypothetical protein